MPKDEWGTKRACPKCGVRFYDLNKDPITGPCGAVYDLASITELYKKPVKETAQKTEEIAETSPILEPDDLSSDPIILDDDAVIELEDELLEDDDDDDDGSVSLEELTDVATESEDN
jgi:uncharacterized protein (TIGR02300 family)